MKERKTITKSIFKVLSPNDIGLTGGHQAGILIPKNKEILSFFPEVNHDEKNPRHFLTFVDESDQRWEFCFIYYNNARFGGTRNEYRLTRMTRFIRSHNLKVGDELHLTNQGEGIKRVTYKRTVELDKNKIALSSEWKVIRI